MCTLHSWVKTHQFMPFTKLVIWESGLFTLIMKLSLPWWLFFRTIFWSSVWKNVNCWANISFKSSQFMRTCIWCQTTGQKSKCCLWPYLSGDVFFNRFSIFLVALDFCNYLLAVREYDGSRPLSSEFVGQSKDSFCVCIFTEFSSLEFFHSPPAFHEMNEGRSVWVVHFIICSGGSVCAGHASASALCALGVLCSPPVLCASPTACTPLLSSCF